MSYILIAEDDPHVQLLIQRKLELAGYIVHTTANGLAALDMIQKNLPRIMLLDIMLPGMTGLELCKKIKQELGANAPPVLIMSARGTIEDVDAAEQAGADDYLIKPFAPSDLLIRIQDLLKRSL